jgi:hypothetical protein
VANEIKLNHGGIQEYLDGKHGVDAVLEREAEERLARAQASAPIESGDYKASLHIETVHTDRMAKRIVADVPYALVVESKTGNLARSL